MCDRYKRRKQFVESDELKLESWPSFSSSSNANLKPKIEIELSVMHLKQHQVAGMRLVMA